MAVFSEGFTCKVGDGAGTEAFNALALLEVPEIFSGSKSTFSRRTTADTGNTKIYGIGLEDGDEMTLTTERDFADASQDLLRVAYAAGEAINLQFLFADGTVVETSTAAFLVTSTPVTGTDPNGDGENVRQMFNVKRNSDWVTAEV
jgi:hypothetical protein